MTFFGTLPKSMWTLLCCRFLSLYIMCTRCVDAWYSWERSSIWGLCLRCCKAIETNRLLGHWYSLASWKRAAIASSHHCDSCVMKGSPIRPRRKISWPAVRATVAIRLHARIMSNCTWGRKRGAVSYFLQCDPNSFAAGWIEAVYH